MIVFKTFMKSVLYKKYVFIGYLLLFTLITVISVNNSPREEEYFKEMPLDIAIVDKSNSPLSNSLIKFLKQTDNISLKDLEFDELREATYLGKYDLSIIIPKDFENLVANKQKSIDLINPAKSVQAALIDIKFKNFFSAASIVLSDDNFDTSVLDTALSKKVDVKLLSTPDKEKNDFDYFFYNFSSFILMSILILVIGNTMIEFGKEELFKRTRISSIGMNSYNLQAYAFQIVTAAIPVILLIIIAKFMKLYYGYEESSIRYILNLIIFAMAVIGMINMVFNIKASTLVMTIMANAMSLGLAFISGIMVGQQHLSPAVLNFSKLFPVYYLVRANTVVMNNESGQLRYLLILMGFSIMYFLIGTLIAKIKSGEFRR
ncbi:MAG: ABC transporter permease [Tissierellia bacterium]|nr:ABC transporter permease [Tissierellia bacterium]